MTTGTTRPNSDCLTGTSLLVFCHLTLCIIATLKASLKKYPEDATTATLQTFMGDNSSPVPHKRPAWTTLLNLLPEGKPHCGQESGNKLLSVKEAPSSLYSLFRDCLTSNSHSVSGAPAAISDVGY